MARPRHVRKEIDLTKAETAYVVIRVPGGCIEIAADASTPAKKIETVVTAIVPTDEHLPAITTHRNNTGNQVVVRAEQLTAEKIVLIPDPKGPALPDDFCGKYAVLNPKRFRGPITHRIVLCRGGSGCQANNMGTKVYGTCVVDNVEYEFRRGDFTRLATMEELATAQALVVKAAEA